MKYRALSLGIVLLVVVLVGVSFADRLVGVRLNGNDMTFDVNPMIENGRTLVPLRAIFEALGAEVIWQGETSSIIAKDDSTEIQIKVGDAKAYVNKKEVVLDVPAKVVDGRTLVPVRFVSEALGASVTWDADKYQVVIERLKVEKVIEAEAKMEPKADIEVKSYDITPIIKMTDEEIKSLNIKIDSMLTAENKAMEILKWQQNNMKYIKGGAGYSDVSDPMRWNYMLPGTYTSKDIITRKDDQASIYGICYDFAIVYAAVADYYGLEVRVAAMEEKPSELSEIASTLNTLTAKGMSMDEYNRYKVFAEKKGQIVYPYDAIRLIAKETSTHYRAEVKIGDSWMPFDGSTSSGDSWISKYKFYPVNWAEGEEYQKLNDYVTRLNNGESLKGEGYGSTYEEFSEGRLISLEDGSAEKYIGLKDDLGNMRAKTFEEFMQGKALLPYYNDKADVKKFMNLVPELEEDLDEAYTIKVNYEKDSQLKFNMIVYVIIMSEMKDSEDPEVDKMTEEYRAFTDDTLDFKRFINIYNQIE